MPLDIRICGVGMTALGRHPQRTVRSLTEEAVRAALHDAGARGSEVQAAWFSNTRQGVMEGQNSIRGQCALRDLEFAGIPIVNVENACASSSTGVLQAAAALAAGFYDAAIVVGAEKMHYPDRSRADVMKAFLGGTDVSAIDELLSELATLAGDDAPIVSDEGHSLFMDIYAALARAHARVHGSTPRQLATIAAKNHVHSTRNPLAQYQYPMTVDAVLADRLVVSPLTRSMCAPLSDGAAALLLATPATARRHGWPTGVRLRGIVLATGTHRRVGQPGVPVACRAAAQAYALAEVEPSAIDVAEVHDATSFAELQQTENLLFCPVGEGGIFAESGATTLGGTLPINVSGGLLSKGHPIAATGTAQLHELVLQLRHSAGPRQVPGARLAIAENGGGFLGLEEAAVTVSILERAH